MTERAERHEWFSPEVVAEIERIERVVTRDHVAAGIGAAKMAEFFATQLRERDERIAELERLPAEANEAIRRLNDVIKRVQRATGDYLPPDGISKDNALNRIIETTDGPDQREAQNLPAVRRALGREEK